MNESDMLIDIQHLPKVELHLHLEGAAPPEFIRRLGQEKNIRLDGVFREDGSYAFRDFPHFLQVYEAAISVLTGPEEFYRLTRAVLAESAAQGVIYTEAFLSPDFCGGSDLAAWRDYLAAIEAAAREMEAEAGIVMRGIATPIRHFGPEKAKRAALCAAETAGGFLTGLGMGGNEAIGKQGDFAYAFDMAREAGLCLTTHAGEWRGPEEIWDALRDLRVARIGHGVRAIEDPALVEHLAETGVTLEVCPGSNIVLGVYERLADHPIDRLERAGVNVTISTDDPPFFHTNMLKEFQNLTSAFDWDISQLRRLNRVAAGAAFCDEATRTSIFSRLEAA